MIPERGLLYTRGDPEEDRAKMKGSTRRNWFWTDDSAPADIEWMEARPSPSKAQQSGPPQASASRSPSQPPPSSPRPVEERRRSSRPPPRHTPPGFFVGSPAPLPPDEEE
jgi:hypothetical protein